MIGISEPLHYNFFSLFHFPTVSRNFKQTRDKSNTSNIHRYPEFNGYIILLDFSVFVFGSMLYISFQKKSIVFLYFYTNYGPQSSLVSISKLLPQLFLSLSFTTSLSHFSFILSLSFHPSYSFYHHHIFHFSLLPYLSFNNGFGL